MWITMDTETLGLDARKFVLGSICTEKLQTKTFYDQHKMYAYILALAHKCKKKNARLTVYAHNMQYDYISLGAHKDARNVIFSTRPFIADFLEEGRKGSYLKWTDTMGLWRGTLASMGNILGYQKSPTPQWLLDGDPEGMKDQGFLWQAGAYCERDTRLLMKFLLHVKKMLQAHGLRPWMMLTAAQLSMQHVLKEMSRQRGKSAFFSSLYKRSLWETRNKLHVQMAYRGGRVEAFVTGKEVPKAEHYDINSLYPAMATQIELPDLRTERTVTEPLTKGFTLHGILQRIGVSTVLVQCPRDDALGVLPIRLNKGQVDSLADPDDGWETGNYLQESYVVYPHHGEYLVGTWTHLELRYALECGYKILALFESTYWQTAETQPFQRIFTDLYTSRKASYDPFQQSFFKMLMNGALGKFAQCRPDIKTKMLDIEDLPQARAEGWETTGMGFMGPRVLVCKDFGVTYRKYYCPIIAASITAAGRIELTRWLRSFPQEALLYCDTDSIIYSSEYKNSTSEKHLRNSVHDGLGGWKLVSSGEPFHCYGKKAYRLGANIRVARIPKKAQTLEAYERGAITFPEIIGIQQATDVSDIGRPTVTTRTLQTHADITYGGVLYDSSLLALETLLPKIQEAVTWRLKEATLSAQSSSL